MLALNLSRIRTASERFEHVLDAEACAAADDPFGIAAPVALGFEVFKDKDRYRLIGTVETTPHDSTPKATRSGLPSIRVVREWVQTEKS